MFVFRTVVWGIIFLFASLIVGPWLALQFDASFPVLEFGNLRYAGMALAALGGVLALYCAGALLIPGKSRPAPYDAGGSFTIAGPYRYVRNPFMLGVILALWGEALITSRIVMIAYAFILTWSIHFWVIFFEEPALTERFGGEYREYRDAVPRWFPQFRKYRG
ncbi:MAG TPA: isoprenylcysteine carboxylmethyltransferase family protein [bacterium]|nr:isoprenylcysteine carboxylmethyltransferase family protein [bacterium]